MEPTKERLQLNLALLEKATQTLNVALEQPLTEFIRDAVIQRFEYAFELSWKTIQVAAQYMGMTCQSPREPVKIAFKIGWIHNADRWLEAMEARNKTSHTYNEALAIEVYQAAKQFPELLKELSAYLNTLAV